LQTASPVEVGKELSAYIVENVQSLSKVNPMLALTSEAFKYGPESLKELFGLEIKCEECNCERMTAKLLNTLLDVTSIDELVISLAHKSSLEMFEKNDRIRQFLADFKQVAPAKEVSECLAGTCGKGLIRNLDLEENLSKIKPAPEKVIHENESSDKKSPFIDIVDMCFSNGKVFLPSSLLSGKGPILSSTKSNKSAKSKESDKKEEPLTYDDSIKLFEKFFTKAHEANTQVKRDIQSKLDSTVVENYSTFKRRALKNKKVSKKSAKKISASENESGSESENNSDSGSSKSNDSGSSESDGDSTKYQELQKELKSLIKGKKDAK